MPDKNNESEGYGSICSKCIAFEYGRWSKPLNEGVFVGAVHGRRLERRGRGTKQKVKLQFYFISQGTSAGEIRSVSNTI